VDTIYHHVVEEKKCPNVSPTGLRSKGDKKEAVAYLKSKKCPELPALKRKTAPAASATATKGGRKPKLEVAISQPAAPVRKTRAKKTVSAADAAHADPKLDAPIEPMKFGGNLSHAKPVEAAPAAAAAPKKAKRAPTAYSTFVGEKLKAGMTMKEAAAAWKASKA
jgi:hypothetical protein